MRLTALGALLALFAGVAPLAVGAEEPADKPKLGVQLEDVPFDPSQGIPIRSVAPGSTAAVLGLQPGDAIKSINGKAISGFTDLMAAVAGLKVGDAVSLAVMRKGAALTVAGKMLAPTTPAVLSKELAEAQVELGKVKRAVDASTREPTLGELIHELELLQEQFPKAAAEFKKLYPNGEFSIVIRITSDKTAAQPVDLMKTPAAIPPGAEVPPGGAKPAPVPSK